MDIKNTTNEETIAAISTAAGEGGIGIIRISGDEALSVLGKVFVPASKKGIENRKLCYGHIIDPKTGETVDEVLAVYMPAPHTYTCEDVAEINCHGSIVALRKTLALVLENGAVLAEPGEFTKRAFLSGRLDLSQAEAVMDLIKAKTDKSFDVALSQLAGSFSAQIKALRAALTDILVELTVNIDYPDEDIEELTYKKLIAAIAAVREKTEKLIASADTGRILRDGFNISIIGKPNVGKSSLMNCLLSESRAIVSDIPGTTRDTIEEFISIRNIPVRLTDTAGIRETEDAVEKLGIEKSKEALARADLVILMLDASKALSSEDEKLIEAVAERKAIVLLNKSDLARETDKKAIEKALPLATVFESSMKNGSGIEEIKDEIESLVYGGQIKQGESTLVTNVRHEELLRKTAAALDDAGKAAQMGEALDIVEIDLKDAYEYLGEITGESVTDDIIDEVFRRFCLGK